MSSLHNGWLCKTMAIIVVWHLAAGYIVTSVLACSCHKMSHDQLSVTNERHLANFCSFSSHNSLMIRDTWQNPMYIVICSRFSVLHSESHFSCLVDTVCVQMTFSVCHCLASLALLSCNFIHQYPVLCCLVRACSRNSSCHLSALKVL